MRIAVALLVTLAVTAWVHMEADVRVLPNGTPKNWKFVGEPHADRLHHTVIVLKHDQAKLAELDRIFWEVSDPKHANYGKYLSHEQVADLLGAPQEKISIVNNWLRSNGVVGKINPNRDMIEADIPVHVLETMLNTKFGLFVRLADQQEFTRIVKPYYLPENIAEIVSIVGNLLDFPASNAPRKVDVGAVGNWPDYCGTSCAGKVVPEVLLQRYNVTQSKPVNAKNSFAVAEFQTQHYDQNDLDKFASACSLSSIKVIDKNGGNVASECNLGLCIESLLDLEYIAGVGGSGIPLADYWLQSYSLLDWIKGVLADANPSLVHSVSYGNDEIQQTSTQYMYDVNTQFQAAGTKGLSIFFASGDQGVWGRSGHNGHFNPDFPAASPYVTAVGGSDFAQPSIGPETCCQDSGGGFSVTFSRPSYQDAAVTGYLKSGVTLPTATNYNASGRAYPDISAIFGLYIPYCISSGGAFEGVAGTSASSPVTASLFANLNNVQLNAGKSPLGFVNPWIYQTLAAHPDAFFDVTTGRNNGGSGEGFYAYSGWDPCSGVGTPNYVNMVKYLP